MQTQPSPCVQAKVAAGAAKQAALLAERKASAAAAAAAKAAAQQAALEEQARLRKQVQVSRRTQSYGLRLRVGSRDAVCLCLRDGQLDLLHS